MDQAIEGLDRSDVGEQPEFFSHCEKPLFGSHFGCGVVVKSWIAHRGKEHRIGPQACTEGLFGERVACPVNGVGSAESVAVFNIMSESLTYCRHHIDALSRDFRSDTVAGENCYLEIHIVCLLCSIIYWGFVLRLSL